MAGRELSRHLRELGVNTRGPAPLTKAQLDELTSRVVSSGLACWAGGEGASALIVRGQAQPAEVSTLPFVPHRYFKP